TGNQCQRGPDQRYPEREVHGAVGTRQMTDLKDRYEGRWWLPDHPERYGGALGVGGNLGGLLQLNGAFPWDLSNRSERWFDFPTILGESVDGDRITLLRGAVSSERSRL